MTDRFEVKADEFKRRIRAARLTPTSDVVLITHFEDSKGNRLPPRLDSLVASTKVKGLRAAQLAAAVHLESIIGNINALVHARKDPNLRVVDFELEISDDADLR
jgi:hypothetical protein